MLIVKVVSYTEPVKKIEFKEVPIKLSNLIENILKQQIISSRHLLDYVMFLNGYRVTLEDNPKLLNSDKIIFIPPIGGG